jgi:hypothetical protein
VKRALRLVDWLVIDVLTVAWAEYGGNLPNYNFGVQLLANGSFISRFIAPGANNLKWLAGAASICFLAV